MNGTETEGRAVQEKNPLRSMCDFLLGNWLPPDLVSVAIVGSLELYRGVGKKHNGSTPSRIILNTIDFT